MTFDEIVSMLFQPGMFEVVEFCVVIAVVLMFVGLLLVCLVELIMSLIHRYIWPGKKKTEEKEAPDA